MTPEHNPSNSGTQEELGRLLREASRSLEEMDLRGANEALKRAAALPDFVDRQSSRDKLREESGPVAREGAPDTG